MNFWRKILITELGFIGKNPNLHRDNTTAIHIMSNSIYHECTKHYEVDFHLLREEKMNN